MRYITKQKEPDSLTHWKEKNKDGRYGDFTPEVKTDLQLSLLKEQGYLCAYCGAPIGMTNGEKFERLPPDTRPGPKCGRIDHIVSQSQDKSRDVDYSNMCYSCNTQGECGVSHCDEYKKNKKLPITPFTSGCHYFFSYDFDGKIVPVGEDVNLIEETIQVLNLHDGSLDLRRKKVLDGVLLCMEQGERGDEIAERLARKDEKGVYSPFFYVPLSWLGRMDLLD